MWVETILTYKSLNVEIHPNQESAVGNYVPNSGVEDFCSLNAHTFPMSSVAFAHKHNLEIYYIDNAWTRVGVIGKNLIKFLTQGAKTEPDWPAVMARIDLNRWYVIVEEEF